MSSATILASTVPLPLGVPIFVGRFTGTAGGTTLQLPGAAALADPALALPVTIISQNAPIPTSAAGFLSAAQIGKLLIQPLNATACTQGATVPTVTALAGGLCTVGAPANNAVFLVTLFSV